jgi:hypothetical protein
MRRSLKALAAASLLSAMAVLVSPSPTFAARAKQPAELLADAYKAIYDAASKAGDSAVEPLVRSQRAAQQAADAVARAKGGKAKESGRSSAAVEAAVKAATEVLHVAPQGWQRSHMMSAYKDAWNAAFKSLNSEKQTGTDPAAQRDVTGLPDNLQSLALRGAKIRADRDAATAAAAVAVARAVSEKVAAEESAGGDAVDGQVAVDQNARGK